MDCKEFEGKLDLYVDGRLGEADAAAMQAHIRSCPACRSAEEQLRGLLAGLHSLPEQELPDDFQKQLHERLITPPRVVPFYRKGWFRAAAGAAAGLFVLVGAAAVFGKSGAAKYSAAADNGYGYAATTTAPAYYADDESMMMAENAYYPEAAAEGEWAVTTGSGNFALRGGGSPAAIQSDKLIYTADVNLNSYAFDADWQSLMDKIQELGGYVESSSISGTAFTLEGGSGRHGWITARVPQEAYQSLADFTRGVGEETYFSSRVENVSSQYTEVETRIASLKAQVARLQELIGEAENMEDLIALEARLSEVTYELEDYQGQKKNLDAQIAYSTLNITLDEQRTASNVAAPQNRRFGQKLADAFSEGWYDFVNSVQGFFLGLAYGLFDLLLFLVLVGGVAALVIFLIRRARRNR